MEVKICLTRESPTKQSEPPTRCSNAWSCPLARSSSSGNRHSPRGTQVRLSTALRHLVSSVLRYLATSLRSIHAPSHQLHVAGNEPFIIACFARSVFEGRFVCGTRALPSAMVMTARASNALMTRKMRGHTILFAGSSIMTDSAEHTELERTSIGVLRLLKEDMAERERELRRDVEAKPVGQGELVKDPEAARLTATARRLCSWTGAALEATARPGVVFGYGGCARLAILAPSPDKVRTFRFLGLPPRVSRSQTN